MDTKELKQKIRRLKLVEIRIRYGFSYAFIEKNKESDKITGLKLLWKDFFCLKDKKGAARYSLSELAAMNKEQLKKVFEEYWFELYYQIYKENGTIIADIQDPELLSYLGLSYDADASQVKKRFHELCRKYHPDDGGNPEEFMQLMKMMQRFK